MLRFAPQSLVLALLIVPLVATAALAADPDKKGKKDKPKDGATKDDYVLDTSGTSNKLKVGADGTFALVIKPAEGLKVHPDAPLEVKLKASPGIKPAKTKLGRADAKDKKATSPELSCGVRAQTAGSQTVEAELSFFLCSKAWCQRMKDKVTVTVDVTP